MRLNDLKTMTIFLKIDGDIIFDHIKKVGTFKHTFIVKNAFSTIALYGI